MAVEGDGRGGWKKKEEEEEEEEERRQCFGSFWTQKWFATSFITQRSRLCLRSYTSLFLSVLVEYWP